MDEAGSEQQAQRLRKAKTKLESRSFRDGAIYLFRRANYKTPIWFCRIKAPNSKSYLTHSTRTTDEHQAYVFANNLLNKAIEHPTSFQLTNSKTTSSAIKEYVEYIREVEAKRTTNETRAKFLLHVATFFKQTRLDQIGTPQLFNLNMWIRQNSRRGRLSPNTIKRYSTDLKQFFNWCLEKGYLDTFPRFPKVKGEQNRRPHFDKTDWQRLTSCMDEFIKSEFPMVVRHRTMLVNYMMILVNTGIRVGEARGLRWSHIKEIPSRNGSNQAANIVLYVKGKTGAREVVARTADIKIFFKRILELRLCELEKMKKHFSQEDYVFCNRDGTTIGSFKKSFIALMKYADVETDLEGNKRTLYSLRHSYATDMLEAGVHQFILAKNMGTSTAMLERHYGHTSNVASAAELMKGGQFKGEKNAKALKWFKE